MSLGLPYVREAKPSEFDEVALVIARAFHNDPLMNWMGAISKKIPLPPRSSMSPTNLSALPKELEILYYFHHSLVLATHMVHGRVLIVCRSDGASQESIVAASLWVPPNTKIDTPLIIIRSKQYRTMFGSWRRPGGWGFTGLKVRRDTCQFALKCET